MERYSEQKFNVCNICDFFVITLSLYTVEPIVTVYVTQLSPNTSHIALLAGLAFSASGLANIISSSILRNISDKVGAQKVMLTALVVAGVIYIPQAFVKDPWQLIVLRFLVGLATAGLNPSVYTLVKKITPDYLTKVVITHQDIDHIGSLGEIKHTHPDIQILADIKEVPYINGEKEPIKVMKFREMYDSLPESQKEMINAVRRLFDNFEPVDVDGTLHDHDIFSWCGNVEIISTPGHTDGRICLYLHEFKTLIAGDALFLENGELVISRPMATLDMEQARQSVKKLLNFDIDKIICYHGGIYEGDIKEALLKISMS